jgi:hypothetical protein
MVQQLLICSPAKRTEGRVLKRYVDTPGSSYGNSPNAHRHMKWIHECGIDIWWNIMQSLKREDILAHAIS